MVFANLNTFRSMIDMNRFEYTSRYSEGTGMFRLNPTEARISASASKILPRIASDLFSAFSSIKVKLSPKEIFLLDCERLAPVVDAAAPVIPFPSIPF